MKASIKKAWLKALRSGEYEQGRQRLLLGEEYCCLAVLYDACVDGDWEQSPLNYERWGIPASGRSPNQSSLPESILQDVGLTEDDQDTLIGMNDFEHQSFSQIAGWIEENVT